LLTPLELERGEPYVPKMPKRKFAQSHGLAKYAVERARMKTKSTAAPKSPTTLLDVTRNGGGTRMRGLTYGIQYGPRY
jgi:hypothetical protein